MAVKNGIRVGIGFATGRKSFQKVLRTHIYNWKESGLVDDASLSLNLIVAYDLDYHKTKETDYTNLHQDLVDQIDSRSFIGAYELREQIADLEEAGVLGAGEARLLFGKGYAGKRNAVLLTAIRKKMDCLVFLDDDEYPLAVTHTRRTAIWSGQQVLSDHLRYIREADITHGHHCGYVSPIPEIGFDGNLSEEVFRRFIEAISNDIVQWDKIRDVIRSGGVTYADTQVLTGDEPFEVEETNGVKFISGANLCINLTRPERVFPFYNPPGARGEDTFLATCLRDRKVLRVPCYTFHDGFGTYNCLLDGVLPIGLKRIAADAPGVAARFHKACVGWIRYKPLLLLVTRPSEYDSLIRDMRRNLEDTLPLLAERFRMPEFMQLLQELDKYARNAEKHLAEFAQTRAVWSRVMEHFSAASRG
ncbi:MAG: hypothetical protein KBA30_05730 [Clostridia bacterium]|nr:hypothetical protein [Clostridia bacterium]